MNCVTHLVTGESMASRPTLATAIREIATARGEAMVAVGQWFEGAEACLPMPSFPSGFVRSISRLLRSGVVEPVTVAWDVASFCLATESRQFTIGALDGLNGPAWMRRRARLRQDRSGLAMCSSSAMLTALGPEDEPGLVSTMLPTVRRSKSCDQSQLRLVVLAEGMDRGLLLGYGPLLGQMHLLGRPMHLTIVGDVADAAQMRGMLKTFEMDPKRRDAGCPWTPSAGDVVLIPDAPLGSRQIPAVAPALRAWASGADVIVPSGHRALEFIDGRPRCHELCGTNLDHILRSIGQSAGDDDQAESIYAKWQAAGLYQLDHAIEIALTGCS